MLSNIHKEFYEIFINCLSPEREDLIESALLSMNTFVSVNQTMNEQLWKLFYYKFKISTDQITQRL